MAQVSGGIPTDVLAPRTSNPQNVLLSIADKNSQATEIIVNLKSNPNLRGKLESEADILAGVRKILKPQDVEMRIKRVRVIE